MGGTGRFADVALKLAKDLDVHGPIGLAHTAQEAVDLVIALWGSK